MNVFERWTRYFKMIFQACTHLWYILYTESSLISIIYNNTLAYTQPEKIIKAGFGPYGVCHYSLHLS